jgi:hypothetical protein
MNPLKKLIPIRLFADRSPLASTAACPQPTPDDWVMHAMDTARLAATAEDLTNNPSIRNVGNVFTQMLQQLQVNSIDQQCLTTTLTFLRNSKRIGSSFVQSRRRSTALLNQLFAMRRSTTRPKHSSECATIS